MDVSNSVDFVKMHEGDYDKVWMISERFRRFYLTFSLIPGINVAIFNEISHIHQDVTLMELRSIFPITEAVVIFSDLFVNILDVIISILKVI